MKREYDFSGAIRGMFYNEKGSSKMKTQILGFGPDTIPAGGTMVLRQVMQRTFRPTKLIVPVRRGAWWWRALARIPLIGRLVTRRDQRWEASLEIDQITIGDKFQIIGGGSGSGGIPAAIFSPTFMGDGSGVGLPGALALDVAAPGTTIEILFRNNWHKPRAISAVMLGVVES